MKVRATYVLILANIIAYASGGVWPLPESPLLYGFSHTNLLHLLLNMLGLLTFGLGVERELGWLRFTALYLASILGGAVTHLTFGPDMPVIGASAGVYGVVIAYACIKQDARVMLLAIPMRARTLALIAMVIEPLMVLFDWLPQIAHWAHIGGMLAAGTLMAGRALCRSV